MGTELSLKIYEIMEKHLESGVPLSDMNLAADQRFRAKICLELYKEFSSNSMMDTRTWLRRKYNRSESEIRNDMALLNFIVSLLEGSTKEISRFRVKHAAEKLMRAGEAQGEWKMLAKGADLLAKVEQLDKDETREDIESTTYKLPFVVGGDVQRIDLNRHSHSEEELERLRKKYGGAKDNMQQMVEAKMGLFVQAGSVVDEEELMGGYEVLPDEEESECSNN